MKNKIIFISIICFCFVGLWLFFKHTSYFSVLNVQYTDCNMPTTKIIIEDKTYTVGIDLGSKKPLFLSRDNLHKLQKNELKEKFKWRDFKGNHYSSNDYSLPKVKLGNIILKKINVSEGSEECEKNTKIAGNPELFTQSIGRPIFEKFKILLDFKNNRIILSNDIKRLKKMGFDISSFLKVPCKMGRTGLILNVETDFGKKKLSIDTGATFTFIRNLKEFKNFQQKHELPFLRTEKFFIENLNFGFREIFLFDLTPELNEIDGFLGMDFLKNHVMYIDFPNKIVYLKKD
jgi:hypothetical protein